MAVNAVQTMLRTVNTYDPREQRARKALEIVDAVLVHGDQLLRYVLFAGVFLMKMIEFRREPFFREGREDMPCPCKFSQLIKEALVKLRLGELAYAQWPLTSSILEDYYVQDAPKGELIAVLDDIDVHLRASKKYLAQIRFLKSLEQRAEDIVHDLEYIHPTDNQRDSWYLGATCRATWSGDGHAFRHDAKIVWISKYRRTCRIVYARWDGWGWETTEYPALVANLKTHENLVSLMCPICDADF